MVKTKEEYVDIRDLDSNERAAFLEAMLESGGDVVARALLTKINNSINEILNWARGSSDQLYPLTLPDGSKAYVPSPYKIAQDTTTQAESVDPGDFAQMFEDELT